MKEGWWIITKVENKMVVIPILGMSGVERWMDAMNRKMVEDDVSLRCVWLIIPGFGPPHVNKKIKWLRKNVEIIRRTIPRSWFLWIFIAQFSSVATPFLENMDNYPDVDRTVWMIRSKSPSYIGGFLREEMRSSLVDPRTVEGVLVLLDDVELEENVNVGKLLRMVRMEDLDVISPVLSRKSASCHWFMHHQYVRNKPVFRRTNFVELFLYVFSPRGYQKWYSLLQPFTVYLWGVDMVMYHQKFRMGIFESMSIIHHFSSKAENNPHYGKMGSELSRYTKVFPEHIAFQFQTLWVCAQPFLKHHPNQSLPHLHSSILKRRFPIDSPPPSSLPF
jgi:hypothetical protein